MAITNGYATLPEARAELSQTTDGYTDDDSVIETRVEMASRAIDAITGRRFYLNSADETRYYQSDNGSLFKCPDDISSITTLKTDTDNSFTYADTWSSDDDYWLEPVNAALNGKPYTQIRVHPTGSYAFPNLPKGIQIIGKFGYFVTAINPMIHVACLLLVNRLFERRNTPLGIGGTAALGNVMLIARRDPDVMELLAPFSRDLGPA